VAGWRKKEPVSRQVLFLRTGQLQASRQRAALGGDRGYPFSPWIGRHFNGFLKRLQGYEVKLLVGSMNPDVDIVEKTIADQGRGGNFSRPFLLLGQ